MKVIYDDLRETVNNNQRFKLNFLSSSIRHAIPCMYRDNLIRECE